jgi:hypothetical protein
MAQLGSHTISFNGQRHYNLPVPSLFYCGVGGESRLTWPGTFTEGGKNILYKKKVTQYYFSL